MLRVPFEQCKTFGMRFHRNDFRVWPEMMAHNGETSDVRADVQDCANVVLTKSVDLILVLKHSISELSTCRFDIKIAAKDLVTSCMLDGTTACKLQSYTDSYIVRPILAGYTLSSRIDSKRANPNRAPGYEPRRLTRCYFLTSTFFLHSEQRSSTTYL